MNNDNNIKSFNLPHIFACKNIVFDCHTLKWRPTRAEDMVMNTTRIDFYPEEDLSAEKKEHYNYFSSLFEDESTTKYFLTRFARAFNGSLQGVHHFNIYTGSGRNGKSLSMTIVMEAFGDYAYTVPSIALTSVAKSAGPNPNLFGLLGKRIAIA